MRRILRFQLPFRMKGEGGVLSEHPKGLFYLFFSEMWERFSFYGMRALLTLYMVEEIFRSLQNKDVVSAIIYSSYGSLVYASPVIGGRIADKILGYRQSIMLGAVFMAIGHFVLAIDSYVAFYAALAFLVVGNGFFKPNISTFVGKLYPEGDTRKDSGFSIFYMGINIGAAAAPIVCGYLAYKFGWHYGFGLAGIGMLAGLLFFQRGIKSGVFGEEGLPPDADKYPSFQRQMFGVSKSVWVYVLSAAAVPLLALIMAAYRQIFVSYGERELFGITLVGLIFFAVGVAVMLYLAYVLVSSSPRDSRKIGAGLVLTALMTIFWGFFELQGSALTLFAARNVNLSFINASQTNSINPVFIILLSVPMSLLWRYLSKRKLNPYTPYKFMLGFLLAGLAFYGLAESKSFADAWGKVPFFYLWFPYLLISVGELFMSPIGLSKITDLAPKHLAAFMMGVWFLSSSYAFLIVGFIGKYMAIENEGGKDSYGFESLEIYTSGFEKIAYVCFATTVLALMIAPFLRKAMREVH